MCGERHLVNEDGLFDPEASLPQDPGIAGTNLGFLVYIFCDGPFVERVRDFVAASTAEFDGPLPADGSHPLRWTTLHAEFRALFEVQLEVVLERAGVDRHEFLDYVNELTRFSATLDDAAVLACSGGLRVGALRRLLAHITAAENYDFFLEVMAAVAAPPMCIEAALSSLAPLPPPLPPIGEASFHFCPPERR